MRKVRQGRKARSVEGAEHVIVAMEHLARHHRRSVNQEMIVAFEAWIAQHQGELMARAEHEAEK